MKHLIISLAVCFLFSCQEEKKLEYSERYIVETTVQLKEGKTEEALKLFAASNPELVKDQPDWLKASFSEVEGEDIVIVRAQWRSKESYQEFSSSDQFKETMNGFRHYFRGRPKVTISKVLFEM